MRTVDDKEDGLRVLVVDGDEDEATALADFLEIVGCETAVAFRARAGERIAEAFEPDLALVDLQVLHSEDCNLAGALRSRGHGTYCVCLAPPEVESKTVEQVGFDLLLHKPLDNDALQRALQACRRPPRLHS